MAKWDFKMISPVVMDIHTDLDKFRHTSEKAMAPHSSTLAWKIPWTEEPDGLLRVGHD